MKIIQFLIVLFSLCMNYIYAQSPDTIWTKIFHTSGDDYGEYVEQTNDGGFIIVGTTDSSGSDDVFLIKTDASGDTLWTKTYGTYHNDYATCVHQTTDDGYIIFGETDSFDPHFWEGWLIKTDSDGDTLWTKHLGDYAYYFIEEGLEIPGSGYVFVGSTKIGAADPEDIWLVKTNLLGDIIWSKTFGGNDRDAPTSICRTSDGGFIISGNTLSYSAGDFDAWIIKTNSNGDLVWSKTYGGTDRDVAYDTKPTDDGGFIIAGHTESFGHVNNYTDAWLIKTDSDGDTVWTKTWGNSNHDGAMSVVQTSDGGFVWTGYLYVSTFVQDLWILKTDQNGNTQWSKNYGGTFNNIGYCINKNSNGNLVVTGNYFDEVSNTRDIWLLMIKSTISSVNGDENTFLPVSNVLEQNYPNPFNPGTNIRYSVCSRQNVLLKLFDVLGNEKIILVNEVKEPGVYEVKFDAASLASGIYFYQLSTGSFVDTKKMIVLK